MRAKPEPIPEPSGGGASFDDILKVSEAKKEAVEKWALWQQARGREYAQVQKIDRDEYLNEKQKALAWERFLVAVSEDNPFSHEDDEMRTQARSRLPYWKEKKVASIPKPQSAPSRPPYDSKDSGKELKARDGIYIAHANGIVRDTKTGLEWIAGHDRDTPWYKAEFWVETLSIDGGGWRMPTREELESLYGKGAGTRNMTPLLKTTGWWVWSGETKDSSSAWHFGFHGGEGGWITRGFSYDTRAFAVRSRR